MPWLELAVTVPIPTGNVLVTTIPVAVVGPKLVTVDLKVIVPPTNAGLGIALWLMPKSASGLTVTVNCRVLVSWPPLAVPPLSLTVTVIVALPLDGPRPR